LYPKFELDASATLLLLNETIRVDPQTSRAKAPRLTPKMCSASPGPVSGPSALRWLPGKRHELELGVPSARPSLRN
jgi:hypothetical protein